VRNGNCGEGKSLETAYSSRYGTVVLITALLLLLMWAPLSAYAPTTFTVPYKQVQFQWRSTGWGGQFGDWSWISGSSPTTSDFTLTGNVLHTSITYSPLVTDLQGASTVYVYNKQEGVWIQKEGTIKYTSPYSQLPITEYWRGYLKFQGSPSASTFVHGVGYQWGYVYGVDEATVQAKYPHAVWDDVMGAWLVGFSIYLWDQTDVTQSYDIQFPAPFIEPVPASSYNPLGL
jgi:hypothetical protein